MARRLGWLIGAPLLVSLLAVACGAGNGGTAAFPSTGAGVCDGLKEAERFRYVFNYVVEWPKPKGPIDESAVGSPPFAVAPTYEELRIDIKHAGSFVQPDRLDFEITLPDQPAVRTIRIGQNQWVNLGGIWVDQGTSPFPFSPPQVCDALLPTLNLATVTGTVEQVSDTEARHFRFSEAPLETASKLFGPESDMGRLLKSYDVDLWLSEDDGRLVKVEAASKAAYPSGRELTIRITLEVGSYNDEEIVVQPPE